MMKNSGKGLLCFLIYSGLCVGIQVILLWGLGKVWDSLWIILTALIFFAYCGASNISLEMRGMRSPMMRTARTDPRQQKASPAAILPYLMAAAAPLVNLLLSWQFFH